MVKYVTVVAAALLLVMTSCSSTLSGEGTSSPSGHDDTAATSPKGIAGSANPDKDESEDAVFVLSDSSSLIPPSGPHAQLIEEAVMTAIANRYRWTIASRGFHEDVFADGEVVWAEYERSKFAAADCLRELGHIVRGPLRYGPDTGALLWVGGDPNLFLYTFVLNPGPTSDEDGQLCQEIWDFTVSQVWTEINMPTEVERQAWLEAAWSCLKQKGMPVSDPPTEREATNATAFGCEPWLAMPSG